VAASAQNGKLVRQRLVQRQKTVGQNALPGAKALVAGLKLSPEQKEQVKSILAGHKTELKDVALGTREARKELAVALAQGADIQTLKAAHDKVSQADWDGILLRSKISAEIKPILTPEQQQRLERRTQIRERVRKIKK
jgi:Spy/CpxP family protein refolding chaperone